MTSYSGTLIDKVKEYLATKYELEYKSKLRYTVEDDFHCLKWDLNNQDQPVVMMGEFQSEDDFFKYVCKEIGVRKIHQVEYFIAKRSDKNGNT